MCSMRYHHRDARGTATLELPRVRRGRVEPSGADRGARRASQRARAHADRGRGPDGYVTIGGRTPRGGRCRRPPLVARALCRRARRRAEPDAARILEATAAVTGVGDDLQLFGRRTVLLTPLLD